MVYVTITIVTGANLNQRSHHWGASHCDTLRLQAVHLLLWIFFVRSLWQMHLGTKDGGQKGSEQMLLRPHNGRRARNDMMTWGKCRNHLTNGEDFQAKIRHWPRIRGFWKQFDGLNKSRFC